MLKEYKGLDGRDTFIEDITKELVDHTAPDVTYIQASCGQGKTYVIKRIIEEVHKKTRDISIIEGKIDQLVENSKEHKLNSLNAIDINVGFAGFSAGLGIGWEKKESHYEQIRQLFNIKFKKQILICIDDISNTDNELRVLMTQIIGFVHRLKKECNKEINILITDTQDLYYDTLYKYSISINHVSLLQYQPKDIENFLNKQNRLLPSDGQQIYKLSQGNLNLVEFIYDEVILQNNSYINALSDIVNRRLAIIKDQGLKNDISRKEMEEIIFAASLALRSFSSQFLTDIIAKEYSKISEGLEIAKNEELLAKDIQKYYSFISDEIQDYIADITMKKRENLSIAYYNYYTLHQQDEYYLRGYYILKYQGKLTHLSISLFFIAYLMARKMDDNLKAKEIENTFSNNCLEDDLKIIFNMVKEFCNHIYDEEDVHTVTEDYYKIQNEYKYVDIVVKAEIVCEYFNYIYMKTPMNTASYINILNQCVGFAMNELSFDTAEIEGIIRGDESLLRLKIIYDIAPCVLDHRNDYEKFQELYHKSIELTNTNPSIKQRGIGEYIENVFNRKAFLFVNQAACSFYYEKAKNYFSKNQIWMEYYITLICQAGTDIVIQEYKEAIILCDKVKKECLEKDIHLPQIAKLHNNELIAKFLLCEQETMNESKIIATAKKTITQLKKLLDNSANATQFVIYTNICSLSLYIDDEQQYLKYKKKLEKLYKCDNVADIANENIDDFYRYYFSWFELYRMIKNDEWEIAQAIIDDLDDFIPALFRKQEIFWKNKNASVKKLIINKTKMNAYDFCNSLVKTKRAEQTLSKFFYRGLMLSDLQYTSYF